MIYIDDNVVNIPTQAGIISFKSTAANVGSNSVILKTQAGNIAITPGAINPGDAVIVLPTQAGNIILKGETDIFCPYIGNVSPRHEEFSLIKTVRRNPDEPSTRWISQTPYQKGYNPSWNVWGNLSIKIDDVEIYNISGANGEEVNLWDYSFQLSEEGTKVELDFTGSYCGMLGASTQVGNVYACLVTI